MGNRAYVVFESGIERSPAVYLHWNGGPESIYAFLAALKRYGADRHNPSYSCARFVQLVGNTLGGVLSLGITCFNKYEDLSCDDNGVYVVTPRRVRRLIDESPDPRHPKLRWLTDEEARAERMQAYRHRYWKPEAGHTSLPDEIRQANDAHFVQTAACGGAT
jgi:hypothetical protein